DALAEADIYIAYGRYLQAAELLNTAIEGEPDNAAYRLKLIELYVDMGEPEQAQEQLDALRELGDSDAVRRGETIVSASAEPEQPDPEPLAEPEPDPGFDPTFETVPVAKAPYQADVAPPARETDVDRQGPAENTAPEKPAAPEASPGGGEAAATHSQDEAVDDAGYGALEDIEYEPLEFSLDEVASSEADIDTPDVATDTAPAGTEAAGSAQPDAEVAGLELEFDELAIEEDEQPAAAPDREDDELDLSDALREAEAPPEPAGEDTGSDERDSEEMMFAADADQVATRLDLARAYLDMGDDDGARRILEQVVAEGSQEQQREAQALLDRIG
ncbi:MAG: FimV/HubP family polar landmark protein, partial [Chromatocurvus sp.]